MPIETLRIVESEVEVSLHPRAIWNHWQKNVFWDPRTYYGVLEFNGVFIILMSFPNREKGPGANYTIQQFCTGAFMILAVSPLHWFSNHRASTSFLTRAVSHVAIMSILVFIISVTQFFPLSPSGAYYPSSEITFYVDLFIRLSIPILLFTSYVVYSVARNPPKDPILAELPSPIDLEDDTCRTPWSDAAVADGIEDDSLEPEGQLRLA